MRKPKHEDKYMLCLFIEETVTAGVSKSCINPLKSCKDMGCIGREQLQRYQRCQIMQNGTEGIFQEKVQFKCS